MIASVLDEGEARVAALRDAVRAGRPDDIAIATRACEAWCDAALLALRTKGAAMGAMNDPGRETFPGRARSLAAGADGVRRMAMRGRRFMRGLLTGSRVTHGAAYRSDARSTGDATAPILISRNA